MKKRNNEKIVPLNTSSSELIKRTEALLGAEYDTLFLLTVDLLKKRFVSLLKMNVGHRRALQVFSDFCEMSAIAFSNVCDQAQHGKREARYMQIVEGYSEKEVCRFSEMLCVFTVLCQRNFGDNLGAIFMELNMGEASLGQFFTPHEVSRLMARILLSNAKPVIEQNGFITLLEPTCGAGGMILAAAEAVEGLGVNYQHCMHVTGRDVDILAVHMAYIQMTIFNIPAILFHGDTLTLETWEYWVSAAHVIARWDLKLYKRLKKMEQVAPEEGADIPSEPQEVVVESNPIHGVSPDVIGKALDAVVMKRAKQLNLF